MQKQKRKDRTEATKEADKFTNTSRWRSLKIDIKRRDRGVCRLCFNRGYVEYKCLQVHHIYKRATHPELAYEPSNLVTVCKKCHEELEEKLVSKQCELLKIDIPKEQINYLL